MSALPSPAVRVRVAPGAAVVLAPHPSGIADMPPLTLHGGQTLLVTPADADQLYYQGKIHHPVTGRIYERRADTCMRVLHGDGAVEDLSDRPRLIHAGGREAAAERERTRIQAEEAAAELAPTGPGDREGRLQPKVTGALPSSFLNPLF
jgi:hypothetical protein